MRTAEQQLKYEIEWLQDNPSFAERPATIAEFLGPDYLNVEQYTRAAIKQVLVDIFGDEVQSHRIAKFTHAMATGAIGIGKTTIASIALPYMAHWALCLRDPQDFFNLMPGSRIAFMEMSTSGKQAEEVVFGDIKARIDASPWFEKYQYDTKFTKQLRFPKNIWILPGDSHETTFEGYNILGGILDEADSHIVNQQGRDYADIGYGTIDNRITSRFQDRGFFLVIGQMKHASGFAKRKYDEFRRRDDAYTSRMTIWDSMGEDFYRCKRTGPHPERPRLAPRSRCNQVHTFPYSVKRKEVLSEDLAAVLGRDDDSILRIPDYYYDQFKNQPEKALRDLAGIPPAVGDPFINHVFKIEAARDRWITRHGRDDGPVDIQNRLADWFIANDSIPRVAHLDIAYSGEGDALGFGMGHVQGVVDIDGELKPYIIMDLLYRVKAPAGGEIYLGNIRHFIYELRDGPTNFRLKTVTYDGFESTDTKQQLRKKRFAVNYVSVDKQLVPYYDLRDALYEDRIEFPPYIVQTSPGSDERVEIAVKELTELVDNGKKIDHPDRGSKDVADCIAGVCFTLMGDRSYRRNVTSLDVHRQQREERRVVGGLSHPAFLGSDGARAPLPPRWRP